MTTIQTFLLAGGMAATFAITICCVVGLGQLHRIVQILEQLEQRPVTTRHYHYYGVDHDYDPPQ